MRPALAAYAIWILLASGPVVAAGQEFRFDDFPAGDVYGGPTHFPDFAGRDRAFANYKTQIRNGMKDGPNFAGAYSLIQIGCGTGCSRAYIADNRTGRVFELPRGGEDHFMLELSFELGSALLMARWADYDNDECVLEFFEWDGSNPTLISKKTLGKREACA